LSENFFGWYSIASVEAANDFQLPAESKSSEGCLQKASQVKAACRKQVKKASQVKAACRKQVK